MRLLFSERVLIYGVRRRRRRLTPFGRVGVAGAFGIAFFDFGFFVNALNCVSYGEPDVTSGWAP